MADQERVIALVETIAGDAGLRDRLSAASESDRSSILSELGYDDVSPADVAASAHLFVPQAVEEIDDDQTGRRGRRWRHRHHRDYHHDSDRRRLRGRGHLGTRLDHRRAEPGFIPRLGIVLFSSKPHPTFPTA